MLTIMELSKKLGVCEKHVYNIGKRQNWEVLRINKVKYYEVDQDDIDQFFLQKETVNSESRLVRERTMHIQLVDLQVLMDKAMGKSNMVYSDKAITMKPSKISLGLNGKDVNKVNRKRLGGTFTGQRICTVEDYANINKVIEGIIKSNIKALSLDIYNHLRDSGMLTFENGEITRKSINVKVNVIRDKIINQYPKAGRG